MSSDFSSPSLMAVPASKSSQRCYLVNDTVTRSLIEHYSEGIVTEYLAYWTAPEDRKIPKFKFTQNWGKSKLTSFVGGDIIGKTAFFSGVCQWLKKAKTFDATIVFCEQLPGWECDLYFYLGQPVDGVQLARVEYGEVFTLSNAEAVVVALHGTDFLTHDPVRSVGLDKWLSEGAKLGYASKLDSIAGSAFPKTSLPSRPPPGGSGPVAKPQSVVAPKPQMAVDAPAPPLIRKASGPPKWSPKCVNLDYNVTTPIYPQVLEAMLPYFTDHFGNPSSAHFFGQEPKNAVDKARRSLLRVIQTSPRDGTDPSSIVFTGSGAESNNLAIRLSLLSSPHKADKNGLIHVISTNVEHPAITECLNSYSAEGGVLTPKISVTYVPVDEEGIVSVDDVINAIRPNTVLVTVMTANSEVGSVQPVFEIAKQCRKREVIFHTDAALAVGKINLRGLANSSTGADMVTLVGHNFGAPKGIAALYIRPGVFNGCGRMNPENDGGVLLLGGGGTENVPYIVGMGHAAEMLFEKKRDSIGRQSDSWQTNAHHMEELRKRLMLDIVKALDPEYSKFLLNFTQELEEEPIVIVNGPFDSEQRLPNTLSIGIKGIRSEEFLANIGNQVACSAGSISILKAINVPWEHAVGALRFSIGPDTTEEEVDSAAKVIVKEANRLL
jgi:cysteine desulfurase